MDLFFSLLVMCGKEFILGRIALAEPWLPGTQQTRAADALMKRKGAAWF